MMPSQNKVRNNEVKALPTTQVSYYFNLKYLWIDVWLVIQRWIFPLLFLIKLRALKGQGQKGLGKSCIDFCPGKSSQKQHNSTSSTVAFSLHFSFHDENCGIERENIRKNGCRYQKAREAERNPQRCVRL